MSVPSPNSPLYFSSSSNGSVDHQDDVSSPAHPTQLGISPVLDASGPNPDGQSIQPKHTSYSDILKLKVGGHNSFEMPNAESELCPQFRDGHRPRNISIGQSSNHSILDPNSVPTQNVPSQVPTISTDELFACCPLGRIWGKPLPLFVIIHRTRNEWKFVKVILNMLKWVTTGSLSVLLIPRTKCLFFMKDLTLSMG